MSKKYLSIIIPTVFLIIFQTAVALGFVINIDETVQDWAKQQIYNSDILTIWSPYNVWLPVFLLSVYAWFTDNKKFILLFLFLLLAGTGWEIISKQFILQPAGVSSCMFDGCQGTLPSGHAFRALFIVGAAIILSRWFLIFLPLSVYTCYGLLVENWHWASDIIAALLLSLVCLGVLFCFYKPRILGVVKLNNKKYA